jgi:hypothetical protein
MTVLLNVWLQHDGLARCNLEPEQTCRDGCGETAYAIPMRMLGQEADTYGRTLANTRPEGSG